MQDVRVLEGRSLNGEAMPLRKIRSKTVERFALSHEPIAMQIQVHLENARVNVDPRTQQTMKYSAKQVLDQVEYIIQYGPDALNAYLGHKERQLLGFRCAQMIQFYGVANVVDYIELVYGRKVIVFKEASNE